MRRHLYNVYWKLQKAIAPGLRSSQYQYESVLDSHARRTARWLDLGCGHALLPAWRAQEEKRLVDGCNMLIGLDYDLPSLKAHPNIHRRVRGDIGTLPFVDDSFDLVTANMVVEHLASPETQFKEVHRVLSPGGMFIFHTPNALSHGVISARIVPDSLKRRIVYLLDGRPTVDVFKAYYRANTRKSITEIAQSSGFEVVEAKLVLTDAIFALIPPLALLELIWLRLLMAAPLQAARTNIVCILRKRHSAHC